MSCWRQQVGPSRSIPAGVLARSGSSGASGASGNVIGAFAASSDMEYPATPGYDVFDFGPGVQVLSTGSTVGAASSNPIPLSGQSLTQALPSIATLNGRGAAGDGSAGSGVAAGYPYGPGSGFQQPVQNISVLDLGQPSFPSISATFSAVPVSGADGCGFWSDLNALIAQNPLVATGLLVALCALIARGRRRGR